jgi:hypothetical protein
MSRNHEISGPSAADGTTATLRIRNGMVAEEEATLRRLSPWA